MDARHEQRDPQREAQHRVRRAAEHGHEPHQRERDEQQPRHRQRHHRNGVRVEHRDHDQGAHVVDDGQGQQEDPQPAREFRLDDGERTDQERGVGGDHHTPRVGVLTGRVEQQEDARGYRESGDRGDDGHRRPGPVGELADGELARHLQADDEEEERHEAVVDQMLDAHVEVVLAERNTHMGVQQAPIAVRPWRIRPDDRDEGERQKQTRRGVLPGLHRLGVAAEPRG